eukprot:scaffold75612_cov66-Attheya_sp.AAC.2
MEAPEQVSELPAHYATPNVNTPDRQRYVASLRLCCCDTTSITVTIDVTGGNWWVWDVKRGGCGACGKEGNSGKQDETVFCSDMKPVVVSGAAGWRKRVD